MPILRVNEVSLKELYNLKNIKDAEKRMLENEHKIQGAEKALLLENHNGALSKKDINRIFGDVGFNTRAIFAGLHGCDANMIYNLDGFVVPGWKYITWPFSIISPTIRNFLVKKYAPGKRRFHLRFFQCDKYSWYVVGHIDIWNWMIPTKNAYEAHHKSAQGDHLLGHMLLEEMLKKISKNLDRQISLYDLDVDDIYQGLVKKYSIDKNSKFLMEEK